MLTWIIPATHAVCCSSQSVIMWITVENNIILNSLYKGYISTACFNHATFGHHHVYLSWPKSNCTNYKKQTKKKLALVLLFSQLPSSDIFQSSVRFSARMLKNVTFCIWPFCTAKEKMIYHYRGDIWVNFLWAFTINHSQYVKTNVPFCEKETITHKLLEISAQS